MDKTEDKPLSDFAKKLDEERDLRMQLGRAQLDAIAADGERAARYETVYAEINERGRSRAEAYAAHLKGVNESNARIATASERQAEALEKIAAALQLRG